MSSQRIGVIGLGFLGSALAERLLSCGYEVSGFDTGAHQCANASQKGVEVTANPSDVFTSADKVIVSLPTSEVVQTVLQEVHQAVLPGHIIVDTTTGGPAHMAAIARRIGQIGAQYLDASVAGSSELARQGKVVVLVGGDESAFRACSDVFSAIANHTFYAGPSGSGAKLKLVHNLILGLNRAVLAEGLHFAKMLDLDPAKTLAILKNTVAHSRVMDLKGDKMVSGDFSPQATLSQHLKDVRLMLGEGESAAGCLPMTSLHKELLEKAENAGYGRQDNSAIIAAFSQFQND